MVKVLECGWGDRHDETLRHRTKGDADYLNTWGNGEQVETIRNQGRHEGRARDLKREESYFSKLHRGVTAQFIVEF